MHESFKSFGKLFDELLYDFSTDCAIVRNFIIFTRLTPIYRYLFYTLSETRGQIFSKLLDSDSKVCST